VPAAEKLLRLNMWFKTIQLRRSSKTIAMG